MFFGVGTPTLLPVHDLIAMKDAVAAAWGLAPGIEITTEANPDSVTAAGLQQLAKAGFTRGSFGMQSAVPRALATLGRTHNPARSPTVVQWAQDAGLQGAPDLFCCARGEAIAAWTISAH